MGNSLFLERLNDSWAEKYKQGTLLGQGRRFWHENWTGMHEIEIIQTKGEKVTIKYLEDDHKETWTLDNLYIFDKDHVARIYQNAIDYGKISKVNFKDVELNTEGIYILHNDKCDDKHGYYVGQAKHIGWRMLDHNHKSGHQDIEKAIAQGSHFSIKIVKLEGSGYNNLNALEAAFIAYFKSFHKFGGGYNKTRGTNGPGNTRTGKRVIAINDSEKQECLVEQNYSSDKIKEICIEFSQWVEEEISKNGVIARKSVLCKLDELGI